MDDFSKPNSIFNGVYPSPNNFVIPYNNPISSAVPSIVLDKDGNVKLIIGGAGGHRIITATFLTLYRHLYFNQTLQDAMKSPRIHHQLVNPTELWYETRWSEFDPQMISQLNQTYGHNLEAGPRNALASLTAVSTMNGKVSAAWDERRSGSSEVFEVEY